MTIILRKNTSAKEIEGAERKLGVKKRRGKSNLARYFGSLKRGLDGLAYQREARGGK